VDDDMLRAGRLLMEVEAALHYLQPTEAEILRLRFGIGERVHDVDEVGERCRVPHARVRAIEARALRKLRAAALEEFFRAQGVDNGAPGLPPRFLT
jgi:DNA-directed RNA polymerase sigma subunit (sigma70/sigma32)